jgi:hypothetical protein
VLVVLAAVLVACTGGRATPTPTLTSSPSASPEATRTGVPVGALGNVDVERLREAFLGEPPYPSGWEAQVDELVATISRLLEDLRVPDVTGLSESEAACAVWQPLVGRTLWSTGALLERQFFVAHLTALADVAPPEIRDAAGEALRISAEAAAEQLRRDGDRAVISRVPREAMRAIGLWAVEHCDLPVRSEEPPDTDGWTAEEIAQSCAWDHDWLVDAQKEYLAGPGNGAYAVHPHQLEVTLEIFVYPAWHRLADVDNAADPPTFIVEPIPGSFCDR